MHEQSLMNCLLGQVDTIRRRHGSDRVTEVRVEVGPLSGVEPLLLSSAFERLATDATISEARLVIDEVSLAAECVACDEHFELVDFDFRCARCGGNVRVTRGDRLMLVSVSLRENQAREHVR